MKLWIIEMLFNSRHCETAVVIQVFEMGRWQCQHARWLFGRLNGALYGSYRVALIGLEVAAFVRWLLACSSACSARPSMIVLLISIKLSMRSEPRITSDECFDTHMERETIPARSWSGRLLPLVPQSLEKTDHMRRFQSRAAMVLGSVTGWSLTAISALVTCANRRYST